MTALLPAPSRAAEQREPWRSRLQPLVGPGGWPATLAVTLLAGLLRFVRLDLPYNRAVGGRIFDEVYYACDAQNLLRYGVEHVTRGDPLAGRCLPTGSGSFVVHPPLGKWAIAIGLKLFGVTPFGWRCVAALAGTVTVLLVVRSGRRLTGSTMLGCLAGLLVAVDGLHLVMSRVALLDVFLVFWITAGFSCLLVDRDGFRTRLAAGRRPGLRPWRLAAGVCLGCGLATKWSALYYIVALALLTVAWEMGARRSAGVRAPFRATARWSTVGSCTVFVLVPLAVYLLSWTGWFVSDIGFNRHWAETAPPGRWDFLPDALRSLWNYHQQAYSFHERLTTPHSYQSHPAGWLLLARPVSFYSAQGVTRGQFGCDAASCARQVLALGNPVLWWGTIPVLVALGWLWVSRRDWRAPALLTLVAAGILPWVRDDLKERTMFCFYALPAVPFMALGAALVGGWLLGDADASPLRRQVGAVAVGTYAALAVGVFAFFYPILTAQTLPISAWQHRMWLHSWV